MSPTIISSDQPVKLIGQDPVEAQKFNQTWEGSHRVLYHTKSIFPFDLFPDEIVIDENKVDIIYGTFFYTNEVFSIPIKKINSAKSFSSIIFGSLEIELEGYNENPSPITFLWNKDAAKARRIINGLVTLDKQKVDLTKLNLSRFKEQVEEIGKSTESSSRVQY